MVKTKTSYRAYILVVNKDNELINIYYNASYEKWKLIKIKTGWKQWIMRSILYSGCVRALHLEGKMTLET